ncbi:O-antigen/teichoic acid export membrane protein [Salinibacter ruber]|jgi:O-antigen/teichoic acid export membrane protein|uniref:oligosaccharide flippase family protein n=1 Tax=Salinibacter ruber TaxID=146919 RepID=UPI002168F0D1|nr:polysaccharide biosynthesis C-terminal domain-containing protein [Salinibacter ruber]MCS3650585.1 O-antigen/teichoic acid export membrane protein [Salinibacter ruber]MCS3653837.1 O-antigen/teichoic acid export membrane protein [Salinibacter ruber]
MKTDLRKVVNEVLGDQFANSIFRIASGSFIVKIIGAGLGFSTEVLLARILSVSEYGIYVYVWTWVYVLAVFCTVGFKGSLVRFASQFRMENEWAKLKGVLRLATQSSLATSFVVGGSFLASIYLYSDGQPSGIAGGLAVGMVVLPFLALNLLRKGALQGLKKVVLADLPYLVIRRVLLAVIATSIYGIWGQFNATVLLVAIAFTLLATVVVATYWLWEALPAEVHNMSPKYQRKQWIQISLPFLFISGASIIQGKTDIIMLGSLGTAGAAGIYGAATRVTTLISFGLNATNMIVAPSISEYYNSGQLKKLQRLVAFSSFGVFIFTVVVGGCLIALGEWILFLFGEEYMTGYVALIVLVIGKSANALLGPVGYLMTMTGRQWLASKVFAVGAVLNVLLNLILIPKYGIMGAAFATGTSITSWNVLLAYFAWNELGVNPTAGAILNSSYWSIKDK